MGVHTLAILDFGIALGYLKGNSWGYTLGFIGAIADLIPLLLLFGILANPVGLVSDPVGLLEPLLLGIVIFTFVYLPKKNVKKWFRVE